MFVGVVFLIYHLLSTYCVPGTVLDKLSRYFIACSQLLELETTTGFMLQVAKPKKPKPPSRGSQPVHGRFLCLNHDVILWPEFLQLLKALGHLLSTS